MFTSQWYLQPCLPASDTYNHVDGEDYFLFQLLLQDLCEYILLPDLSRYQLMDEYRHLDTSKEGIYVC